MSENDQDAAARRRRYLADHNDVLELLEAANNDDFTTWYEILGRLIQRAQETDGNTSNFMWMLSHLAADHMGRTAAARGMTFEEALHQTRLEGAAMVDPPIS